MKLNHSKHAHDQTSISCGLQFQLCVRNSSVHFHRQSTHRVRLSLLVIIVVNIEYFSEVGTRRDKSLSQQQHKINMAHLEMTSNIKRLQIQASHQFQLSNRG